MSWREELAWAAGFFDGEGSTTVSIKNGRARLRVSVPQTNRETLERFKSAVLGLGRIHGPMKRHSERHAPLWQFGSASFEQTQAIIAMLWPFLSEIKRTQARFAIERVKKEITSRANVKMFRRHTKAEMERAKHDYETSTEFVSQIAARLGLTPQAICGWATKHGWTRAAGARRNPGYGQCR